MTRDPLGYLDGMNRYQYVTGDPIGSVDPFGLLTNFDFLMHYLSGRGTPIALTGADLLAYQSHPAVTQATRNIRNSFYDSLLAESEELASSLDCDCGPPYGLWYAEKYYSKDVSRPIARTSFVKVWPVPGDIVNQYRFWFQDWTFSVGGHILEGKGDCWAYAHCGNVGGIPGLVSIGGACSIAFMVRDRFEDPLSIEDFARMIRIGLPSGTGDRIFRLLAAGAGTPFGITVDWNDHVDLDAMMKHDDTPGCDYAD